VDSGDGVAGMTTHAECSLRHRGVMAVGVAIEVEGVALRTVLAALNDCPRWRNHQVWRRGMAIGATVVVDRQRIVGQMTKCHAGRGVEEDTESRSRVIDRSMATRRLLIVMTVEAVDGAGTIARYDILHRGADRNLGVDIPGCIMAGDAKVMVDV